MSPLASLVASETRRLRSTIPPPSSGIFASRPLAAVAAELYLSPLSIPASEELDAPPTDIDDLLSAMHESVHELPTYRP